MSSPSSEPESSVDTFEGLFTRFVESYLASESGRAHGQSYKDGREQGRKNFERVVADAEAGQDVTDAVLLKLLPHADTTGNRERGAWICVAPAVTKDLKTWFEGAGWAKPHDWPAIAQSILTFIRRCNDRPEDLSQACADFSGSTYSKGLQTGMLSPILNALRPDDFLIINNKSRRVINHFSDQKFRADLMDYPAANATVHRFVAENHAFLEQAVGGDIVLADALDMFSHWLVAIEKYNFGKVRCWKIAPGKDAWNWETCRDEGFIAVGWDELGDLGGVSDSEFTERSSKFVDKINGWTVKGSRQAWRFANRILPGDRIIANRGTTEILGIGTVTGDYYFVPDTKHGHRLPVDWDDVTHRQVKENGWKRTLSCDLHRQPTIGVIESVAGETKFRFMEGDSRRIDLEETDLLFIDTLHEYDQLRAELARHSGNVRKWIVLHDTESFRAEGEAGGRGLWPAVEEFVRNGQWRIAKHYENNNGLTVLERIVHTPGVTLITPTGDRPEAFALCVKWMQRQQCEKVGPLQWIIVDDGRKPIDRSLLSTLDPQLWTIQYIRREPQPKDPPHTLCMNMQLALPHIQHDKVLIIEDDDYYAPDYIATMAGWLEQADLVGEVGAKYYYLDSRSYYHFREHQHASWCRTGFRPSVMPTVWKEAARTNQWSLDLRVWEAWSGSKHRWIDEAGNRALCIGIKGVPGRVGATWKSGRASYADPGLKQLRTWLGDDATDYNPLLTSRQRVKAPSAKIVVYTSIFDGYDRLLTDHVVNEGVKYVCFTDAGITDAGPWELQRVERTQKSGRRENRRYKLLSHRWFPDADYTIYFDGCSKLLIDPVDLVNYCESCDPHMARRNEAKLFTCRHPERDCLYAEADVCIRTRRDDPDTIRQQIERYRKEAFPEHASLPHGGLLIRKRGCEFFNQCWWDEVMAGSCRDQISFPYAVRRSGIGHVLLPDPIEKFTERLRHAQPYRI